MSPCEKFPTNICLPLTCASLNLAGIPPVTVNYRNQAIFSRKRNNSPPNCAKIRLQLGGLAKFRAEGHARYQSSKMAAASARELSQMWATIYHAHKIAGKKEQGRCAAVNLFFVSFYLINAQSFASVCMCLCLVRKRMANRVFYD